MKSKNKNTYAEKKWLDARFAMLLILIFAFAIAIRAYNLDWENLNYGEIEVLQSATDYAKGNIVNSFYIFDTPPLGKYIFAISYSSISGIEIAARSVALLFGVLSLAVLYLLSSRLYGNKTALTATAIAAASIIQIQFSRDGRMDAILSFFSLLTLYFAFTLIEKKGKKDRLTYVMLGAAAALGMLTKFDMVVTVVSVVVILWRGGLISVGARKYFHLNIDNSILKALAAAIIVFFLLWPFSLLTMETNVKIDVNGHGVDTTAEVPILLLSLGKRFSSVLDHGQQVQSVSYLSYLEALFLKESLVFVVLVVAGLYYMIFRTRSRQDEFVLIYIVVSMAALSLTSFNFTYRHLLTVTPLLSIAAARSFLLLKKENIRTVVTVAAVLLMAAVAVLSSPSYPLYYNELKQFSGLQESEGRFSEGSRKLASVIEADCPTFYGDPFYVFMLEPYNSNYRESEPDCFVFNEFSTEKITSYVSDNDCSMLKTIENRGVELIYVYSCTY